MVTLLTYLLGALCISFLCSVLEAVLMSTPISFITAKEEDGAKSASLFKKYKLEPEKPLEAILTLNTIAHTVGAAGVGQKGVEIFGNEWFGLISAIMTLLILVLSEIIPKVIGTSYWRNLTSFTAYTIRVLIFVLYPIVLMLDIISKLFTPKGSEAAISREEVSAMANVGKEEGVIEENENKIIQNIMKLDNIKVYDVMTPRVVSAIARESMTLRDFYDSDDYMHFSRIPVYTESPEYITGYVLRSDALEELTEDNFNMTLGELRRDIPFFHEEQSISAVWASLLKDKSQIALIIDGYGCFQGILTLEDIIETILGLEIIDENDEVSDLQQFARERWESRQKQYQRLRTLPLKTNAKASQKEDFEEDN